MCNIFTYICEPETLFQYQFQSPIFISISAIPTNSLKISEDIRLVLATQVPDDSYHLTSNLSHGEKCKVYSVVLRRLVKQITQDCCDMLICYNPCHIARIQI